MKYANVADLLPECDCTPGSLGVEVRIKPRLEGDALAFYGYRLGDAPCFYRYGARLERVKAWSYPPAITVGSRWIERDGQFQRRILVVGDGRDPQRPDRAVGYEAITVVRGKIAIATIGDDGKPRSARVTYCSPERFDGRAGNYVPDAP